MRMRKRLVVAVLLFVVGDLLFTCCHHKQHETKSDTLGTPSVMSDSSNVVDSVPSADRAGRVSATSTRDELVLRRDTAEVTNLRLLARKQRTIYSPALLVGEWQHEGEHEQYIADGSGNRWDIGDDIDRREAQPFSWTMDSNLLTMKYTMSLGGIVVRQYVVTFVDDETLVYRDAYGGSFMWDKVPAGFTDRPSTVQ